jgi:Tol biopolymer transport system component
MSRGSSLLAPRPTSTKWLALACSLVVVGIAATACGDEEVFTGEPSGTIAFVTNRDGDDEIYLMNGDGSEQVNIANNEAADSEPWWSPDASRLIFKSFRTGPANIFVMSPDGSDVEQLTDNSAVEGGARWSPDGARIAFYSFRRQREGLMWVMGSDGSDPQPVLKDQVPSPQTTCAGGFPGGWFPDGQRILYRGSEGGISALQICSVEPDGSDIKIVLSESGVMSYFPSLSPDGRKIAFTSDRDGNPEIYVMNVDGGGLRRLTNDEDGTRNEDGNHADPGLGDCRDGLDNDGDTLVDSDDSDCRIIDEYPTWSPDGQWIAFHSDRDGDFDIYIVRPDGSDLRRLTDNDDNNDVQPSWSPQ